MVIFNQGHESIIHIALQKILLQTLSARQMITTNAFFLLNLTAIISLHASINHERICQATHFGVLLTKTTKVLEYAKIAVLQVNNTTNLLIDWSFYLFLSVCRLSSASVCNVFGTYNCSTSQCYCKLDYEGELCEKCKWREFSFVSAQRINGTIDPINGYGITCKQGILYHFETWSKTQIVVFKILMIFFSLIT